jgi:hypothetical protein
MNWNQVGLTVGVTSLRLFAAALNRKPKTTLLAVVITFGGMYGCVQDFVQGFAGETTTAAPVVAEMTAEQKAANDALWEQKQAEATAKAEAEKVAAVSAKRFAACEAMDRGGWLNDGGRGYLELHTDAVANMCPWHQAKIDNMWAQRNAGSYADYKAATDVADAAVDSGSW